MRQGILAVLGAYVLWGFLPIYWKMLQHVSPSLVLSHRILWSFVFLFILLKATGHLRPFPSLSPKVWCIYILSSCIIGMNWYLYIWSVNAGFIVQTSLGYYINPLFSVLLGLLFLGEKLRKMQWVAFFLAACGVLYMTLVGGKFPWVALTLAFTFALYGLAKKKAPLASTPGLALETSFLIPLAMVFIGWNEFAGAQTFFESDLVTILLLMGAGVVTSLPLLLFAKAVHRIPLYMIGFFQYLSPTIQFLLGVFLFHEDFGRDQLIGFSLVWISVLIFCLEGLFTMQRHRHEKARPVHS